MATQNNEQKSGRAFFDILDDKVIEKAEKEANIKNLENVLSIANECTTLEEFISKIQAMIDSNKERINQIKLENK